MSVEILLPEGRLVSGHPMKLFERTDDVTKQPVLKDGVKVMESNIGVAIPKIQGVHWQQTQWGMAFVSAATDPVKGWPNGETRRADFSWKVIDGDSDIPNKKGNVPNQQEGYRGHWVIFLKTQILYPCYHVGHYQPHECIQNAAELKTGDYVRVFVEVVGNNPAKSPGIYINPKMLELSRVGEAMAKSAPQYDAGAVFGGAPAQPAAAAPQLPVAATAPVPTPAHDLVQPGAVGIAPPAPPAPPAPVAEEVYIVNGQRFTKSQLVASGYTDAHFVTLQRA